MKMTTDPRTRTPIRALAVVIVAMLLVAVTLYVSSVGTFGRPRLVRGLDFEWGDANSQFDRKLRLMLPSGTSDDDVKSILVREGLDLQGEQMAARTWGWFPCRYHVQVYWRLDEQRRLTDIRGDYGASCT